MSSILATPDQIAKYEVVIGLETHVQLATNTLKQNLSRTMPPKIVVLGGGFAGLS